MRKAILKSGIAAVTVASAVALATPAAHASGTYSKYVTTYWGSTADSQCNAQGQADERNLGTAFYECVPTERTIHGGVTQTGDMLYDYYWIS
ncbi:hypothetical protein GCM10009838_48530 [Catenulispora subtropica]|uniref:Secreted protein n=2 Tax=Catenulispora subtropica TaxID=450798 RepID=A0ABN2S738_9ACTN